MKKAWVLSYSLSAERRLWSDWADAQADLSHPLSLIWVFAGRTATLLVLSYRGSNSWYQALTLPCWYFCLTIQLLNNLTDITLCNFIFFGWLKTRRMMAVYNETLLREYNFDKIREYAPEMAFVVIISTLGILGNFVSLAYYLKRKNKSTTTYLLTVLSVNDFIVSIVLLNVIFVICFTVNFRSAAWCKLIFFLNHVGVSNSLMFLLLIGIDRYFRVCRAFYKTILSLRIVKRTLRGFIAFSVCAPLVTLWFWMQRGSMWRSTRTRPSSATSVGTRVKHSCWRRRAFSTPLTPLLLWV